MKRTYSRERMTNLAAFVSLIQATLYLGFIVYFLEIFFSESKVPLERHRTVLHHLTSSTKNLFKVTLFFAGFIHLAWFVSSIYVLMGNRNGNEKSVSQYVAITMLVNLMDIIFPFIVLPSAFSVFGLALEKQTIEHENREEPVLMNEKDYGPYFWLLMTFIRGGCFTFLIDMLSSTVAYQRFMELHDLRIKVRGNEGLPGAGKPMFPLTDESCIDIRRFQETPEEIRQPEEGETTYVPAQPDEDRDEDEIEPSRV